MTDRGTVRDTYVAAIQHDLVELSGDEHLVGVVRRPTPWFHGAVDENRPALGPPEDLLTDVKERAEDLKRQGICDEGAHNAAWDEVSYDERYAAHLAESEAAQAALTELEERLAAGEDVVLVCYEGEDKRCHRRTLRDRLADGTDTAPTS